MVTSDAVYNRIGTFDYSLLGKPDNNGYPSYLLVANVTDWWNSSSGATQKGIVGILIGNIRSGYLWVTNIYHVIAGVAYGRTTSVTNGAKVSVIDTVRSDQQHVTIRYLKNNNNYYLALMFDGSGVDYHFLGKKTNALDSIQWVNTTNNEGNLPSGWEVVTP